MVLDVDNKTETVAEVPPMLKASFAFNEIYPKLHCNGNSLSPNLNLRNVLSVEYIEGEGCRQYRNFYS